MANLVSSSRALKGGIVLLDPGTSEVQRIIALQYNPESLSRTLQVQAVGEDGDRSQALRIRGPAVETLKLEAEMDALDQLRMSAADDETTEDGLLPDLAALESLVHPSSEALLANQALADSGELEIFPMEEPLALFVWSKNRILPVRVTELSVTEEAFDPRLVPIRAKVSLGLRVLSVDDLGFNHKGGTLFMSHLQNKEQLAGKAPRARLATLGLELGDLQ